MKKDVNNIDAMGRLGIPKYVRKHLGVDYNEPVEFCLKDDGTVTLKAHRRRCVFCGDIDDLTEYNGKSLCVECVEKIKAL